MRILFYAVKLTPNLEQTSLEEIPILCHGIAAENILQCSPNPSRIDPVSTSQKINELNDNKLTSEVSGASSCCTALMVIMVRGAQCFLLQL